MENTRLLLWAINATSMNPVKGWKTPKDIMSLPEIDGVKTVKQVTNGEMKAMLEHMKKVTGNPNLEFLKTPQKTE